MAYYKRLFDKHNKYYNKKSRDFEGNTFDSKKEMYRYSDLVLLEKAGEISELERQIKYTLIPSQYKYGKCIERECSYTCDFRYKDKNGDVIVEDVKSEITKKNKDYIIKRKLMLYIHNIKIKQV